MSSPTHMSSYTKGRVVSGVASLGAMEAKYPYVVLLPIDPG